MSDNNNQRSSSVLTLSEESVFGDDKAYSLSINQNGKVRLNITSATINNGQRSWDFKNSANQTGVSFDLEDAYKLLLACQQLSRIYLARKAPGADLVNNPILNTTQISIPLIAKQSGNVYGEILVIVAEVDGQERFGVKYIYETPERATVTDWFAFRVASGVESDMIYETSDRQVLHKTHTHHLQFANFMTRLATIIRYGSMALSQSKIVKYSGGSGGGGSSRNSYRGGNYGGGNTGGESSGGGSNGGGSSQDPEDDIPF